MEKNNISVVVCVKNEEQNIAECLASIKMEHPDEIIVVDGNSSDNTVKIARRYTDNIVITKDSNLTRDRQIGINRASCDYIALIDGDHRLRHGDLLSLLADLKTYNFDIVQSQLWSSLDDNWMNKGEAEMWDVNHNHPGPKTMVGVAPAMYRKSIFHEVYFDDDITSTIDDTDFIYRVSLNKSLSFGVGNTKIEQVHKCTCGEYWRKFKWYGIGDGEFCYKHPNRAFSMVFHLCVRYPIIYVFKCLLNGKLYAAPFCFLQGVIRAKWMFKKLFSLKFC